MCRFPVEYGRYIEVFGGGGWVLFHKPPGGMEVYNDFNELLVNLYRCVREHPEELIDKLRYVLNSRTDFEAVRKKLNRSEASGDIERAAWFYQIVRFSYGSALKSYGGQPHDIWDDFPLIREASRRLGDVVVENRDFQPLIRQYDREDAFFYCDPPYHTTENYYQNIGEGGFAEADHIRLRDTLAGIQGKFLLSYNDDEFIRELYDRPEFHIESISRLDNLRQRYDPNAQFSELFISNYDTEERRRLQLSLFD